jgi:hypothetical protein
MEALRQLKAGAGAPRVDSPPSPPVMRDAAGERPWSAPLHQLAAKVPTHVEAPSGGMVGATIPAGGVGLGFTSAGGSAIVDNKLSCRRCKFARTCRRTWPASASTASSRRTIFPGTARRRQCACGAGRAAIMLRSVRRRVRRRGVGVKRIQRMDWASRWATGGRVLRFSEVVASVRWRPTRRVWP